MSTRIVVLADTHIGRRGQRRLPDPVLQALRSCDGVLHAGDIVVGDVLDELRTYAPTWAVLGNNDRDLVGVLPDTLTVDLDGVAVAMVHDSGSSVGRAARLHRRFPDADVVVFGHSHIPWDEDGVGGQVLFNPGSAIERRRQPACTYGVLELDAGRVARREIIPIP